MMINCSEIKEYISKSASSLFNCELENDVLKISTPFNYPDGDDIELYIETYNDSIILSDLSETYRYLLTYSMEISNSKKRKSTIENIVQTHNIRFKNGTFYVIIKNTENLLEALINLSQAVIRVSDLVYNLRVNSIGYFREEVVDLLEANNIEYETNYIIKTPTTESNYTFDFAVESKRGIINLMNLATTNKNGKKPPIDTFVKTWLDVGLHMSEDYPKQNRITLLDDISYEWKPNDYVLLTNLSEVYKWSNKESLIDKFNKTA